MRSDQMQTLQDTHRSVSAVMPLVTAGLTVVGLVLANMERKNGQRVAEQEAMRQTGMQQGQFYAPRPMQPSQPQPSQPSFGYPYAVAPQVTRVVPVVTPVAARQVAYRPRRLTLFGYIGALLRHVFLVLFGMVAVGALVVMYFSADATGRAIELTTLILLILYLTERVARARRRA